MSNRYFVIKCDKGYYAEKQQYEWTFTDDFWKAKMYKNEMSCWKWLYFMYNHSHNCSGDEYDNKLNFKMFEIEIDNVSSTNENEISMSKKITNQKELPFRFNSYGMLIYPEHIVAKIKGKQK